MSNDKETRIQIIGCQFGECTFQAATRCYKCNKMLCPIHTRDERLALRCCWDIEQVPMCPDCGTSNYALLIGLTILSVVVAIILILVIS